MRDGKLLFSFERFQNDGNKRSVVRTWNETLIKNLFISFFLSLPFFFPLPFFPSSLSFCSFRLKKAIIAFTFWMVGWFEFERICSSWNVERGDDYKAEFHRWSHLSRISALIVFDVIAIRWKAFNFIGRVGGGGKRANFIEGLISFQRYYIPLIVYEWSIVKRG